MTAELRRMDDERMTRLEEKVDEILQLVLKLPCDKHIEKFDHLRADIGWIQKILYGLIPVVLGTAVAWGGISTTVSRNTEIIKQLQEKSYGYRDIPVVVKDEPSRVRV